MWNDVLSSFYGGTLYSRDELEQELEWREEIVDKYEEDGVYSGDSYYQDALGVLGAVREALDNFSEYYREEEDGSLVYIYPKES